MDKKEFRDKIISSIEAHRSELTEISNYIFNNPELGEKEFKSSAYLQTVLTKHGFTIDKPCEHLPTAFVAEYGSGSMTIAFTAEFDALPGILKNGDPAHACGHNWIAATMCCCGIILSEFQNEIPCKIKVIGSPAEETLGAKYDLCKAGVFDNVDLAFQAHLDDHNCLETRMLALNSIEFSFHGRAAHAAQIPEEGINALDSIILMFNGIGLLRQQLRSDARIHGIITAGGVATNIIPDFTQCKVSFRANDKEYLEEMRNKIINIAIGAARMTGTTLDYRDYENPLDDMVNLSSLIDICEDNFKAAGITDFITKEEYTEAGSSDIGNVSHICPTLYVELDPEAGQKLILHNESALAIVDSPSAHRKSEQAIEAFMLSIFDIAANKNRLTAVKEEFQITTGISSNH
jgi:amidohydrolase